MKEEAWSTSGKWRWPLIFFSPPVLPFRFKWHLFLSVGYGTLSKWGGIDRETSWERGELRYTLFPPPPADFPKHIGKKEGLLPPQNGVFPSGTDKSCPIMRRRSL